jgi:hypothetical protein
MDFIGGRIELDKGFASKSVKTTCLHLLTDRRRSRRALQENALAGMNKGADAYLALPIPGSVHGTEVFRFVQSSPVRDPTVTSRSCSNGFNAIRNNHPKIKGVHRNRWFVF